MSQEPGNPMDSQPPPAPPKRAVEVLGRVAPSPVGRGPAAGVDALSDSAVERRERTRGQRPDPRSEDDTGPVVEQVRASLVDAVGTASLRPPGPRPGLSPNQRATKLVDELKICGPGDEGPLMAPLLALGEDALVSALAAFPGARWFNRYRPHVRMPSGRDLSPICRLFVAFGDQAVPYVLPLLDSERPDDRYMGALVAGDIGHGDFVVHLGQMLFDPDPTLRDAAVHALSGFPPAPELDALAERLRGQLANPQTDTDYRLFALRAVGALRLARAIPEVIPLLGASSSHVREAARRVLVALTGADFGTDAGKWRTWHLCHHGTPRAAWLVEGLGHPEAAVREVALRELERVTGAKVDFDPSGSWIARLLGRRRWRAWLRQHPHPA